MRSGPDPKPGLTVFAGRRVERPYSSSRRGEDAVDARAPPRQRQRARGHRQRALREKLSAFRRVQRRQCADARDGVDLGPLSVANSCSREQFAGPLETPASKPPLKLQGPQTSVHSIGPTHVTKKPRPILRAPPKAMLEQLGGEEQGGCVVSLHDLVQEVEVDQHESRRLRRQACRTRR